MTTQTLSELLKVTSGPAGVGVQSANVDGDGNLTITFENGVTQGPFNIKGPPGSSVLSGSGAPASGLGGSGDFYLNTANFDLYGPKTAGAWGAPQSLTGQATAAQAAQAAAEAARDAAQTAAADLPHITISSNPPSGGSDGDVWFKVP